MWLVRRGVSLGSGFEGLKVTSGALSLPLYVISELSAASPAVCSCAFALSPRMLTCGNCKSN